MTLCQWRKACRTTPAARNHTVENHQLFDDLNVFYCRISKPTFTPLTYSNSDIFLFLPILHWLQSSSLFSVHPPLWFGSATMQGRIFSAVSMTEKKSLVHLVLLNGGLEASQQTHHTLDKSCPAFFPLAVTAQQNSLTQEQNRFLPHTITLTNSS